MHPKNRGGLRAMKTYPLEQDRRDGTLLEYAVYENNENESIQESESGSGSESSQSQRKIENVASPAGLAAVPVWVWQYFCAAPLQSFA